MSSPSRNQLLAGLCAACLGFFLCNLGLSRLERLQEQVRILSLSQEQLLPVGSVVLFPARVIPSDGRYLECNGQELPIHAYPALHSAIGGAWSPSNTTPGHFRVPDLRGTFPRFAGEGRKIGLEGKEDWATGMPRTPFRVPVGGAHSHSFPKPLMWEPSPGPKFVGGGNGPNDPGGRGGDVGSTNTDGAHEHTVQGGDPETRPVNYGLLALIRAK